MKDKKLAEATDSILSLSGGFLQETVSDMDNMEKCYRKMPHIRAFFVYLLNITDGTYFAK